MMPFPEKQTAEKILHKTAEKIGKTEWYFAMHYYRFLEILTVILQKRNTKKRETVLELGVWPGYLSQALFEAGFDVWGVDFNPERLKNIDPGISLCRHDLNEAPLRIPHPDGFFDFIIISETIEHLDSKNLPELFTEIRRLLCQNGTLILTTPSKNSLHNQLSFLTKTRKVPQGGHGHLREYSQKELREILVASRMKTVKLETINFYLNIGKAAPDKYFYPLKNFYQHSNKLFNLLKYFAIPLKKIAWLKDSIILIAQK